MSKSICMKKQSKYEFRKYRQLQGPKGKIYNPKNWCKMYHWNNNIVQPSFPQVSVRQETNTLSSLAKRQIEEITSLGIEF